MSLAAIKTWGNEILFAADLNAEFANIRTNALALISPLTGNLDAGAFRVTNIAAGSVGSPSLQVGASNTGIFAESAHSLNLVASGATILLADSTANATTVRITQGAATAGPTLDLYQNNVGAQQGTIRFLGIDTAPGIVTIGQIFGQYLDATTGSISTQMDFTVYAAGAANLAFLSTLGVWTDASLAANKEYTGDVDDVCGKMRQLKTLGVYVGKGSESLSSERHFSPTAEDFYEVFGLGSKPTEEQGGIAAKDVAWLAVRMCQELEERIDGR